MEDELIQIKAQMKRRKKQSNQKNKVWKNKLSQFGIKISCTILLTLGVLITLKSNEQWKKTVYEKVFSANFSFASVNAWYQKQFGSPIPFANLLLKEEIKPVFQEKLSYKEATKYKDGVKLSVDKNYLIPVNQSGLVVFIGEKEGYGNTVIVQQVDGTDLWYGNVSNVNVKLYDYVTQNSLLGETKDDFFYLVFKKEGKALNYQDYLS